MIRKPMYRVEFRPKAKKQLDKFTKDARARIVSAADALSADPRPRGYRKLSGNEDLYRIRVGDYRVIYSIKDDILLVLVVRVGARKDVYRGM